jgi:hypothetical protein
MGLLTRTLSFMEDSMQRIISLALIAALLGSGCALRRGTPAAFSTAHAPAGATRQAADSRDVEDRRKYVEQLPAGTMVRIDLADGTHLTGTLMGVEHDVVIVQPKTRLPVASRRIPLQSIVSLTTESGNFNVGKALAIGAGAGAASFFVLFTIAMTLLDD